MARKEKPPQRYPISVQRNGKPYKADYYVESGVVIVEATSEDGTIARNQAIVGGSIAEAMARVLLREMVNAGRVLESRQAIWTMTKS